MPLFRSAATVPEFSSTEYLVQFLKTLGKRKAYVKLKPTKIISKLMIED
jgi:hypothetical protein